MKKRTSLILATICAACLLPACNTVEIKAKTTKTLTNGVVEAQELTGTANGLFSTQGVEKLSGVNKTWNGPSQSLGMSGVNQDSTQALQYFVQGMAVAKEAFLAEKGSTTGTTAVSTSGVSYDFPAMLKELRDMNVNIQQVLQQFLSRATNTLNTLIVK
jgi:hypothetical protein